MDEQGHFIVTLYVDTERRDPRYNYLDIVMADLAKNAASYGINVKNWIVDDDEDPEAHLA